MPNQKTARHLRQQISIAIQQLQTANDALDEAAAAVLGINRTDFRACAILAHSGRLRASALAKETGLSRGAMTTALDRLEQAGYVRRVPAREDRRSVIVELTEKMTRKAALIWGPLGRDGDRVLEKYSKEELGVIARFLQVIKELQDLHAERIRQM